MGGWMAGPRLESSQSRAGAVPATGGCAGIGGGRPKAARAWLVTCDRRWLVGLRSAADE